MFKFNKLGALLTVTVVAQLWIPSEQSFFHSIASKVADRAEELIGKGADALEEGVINLGSTVGESAAVIGGEVHYVASTVDKGTHAVVSTVTDGIHGLTVKARNIVSSLGAPAHLSWNPDDVHFFWYSNPTDASERMELIFEDLESLTDLPRNRPLIMITHGFREDTLQDGSSTQIKDDYMEAGYADHSNIILVDWGRMSGISPVQIFLADTLALLPVYIGAVSDVYVVGQRVAEFLAFLVNNQIVSGGKDIHLVGHSLGAQVSGLAGRHFKTAVPGDKISRITGSDPAGPLFQFIPIDYRLDPTDADYVDVIHTNQGVFGYILQTGQADFFLNGGGPLQPFCASWADPLGCSHGLSPKFFAKSIQNYEILGTCRKEKTCFPADTVTFGEHSLPGTTGSFDVDVSLY